MKHYILVHGAWEESRAWAEVSAILQQSGHTVTAIDLPGHGGNERSLSEITMAGYIQSLVDTINSKLFSGDPVEASVRDDLSPEDLESFLREPGITYVRE